jgi:hypothetical protein
MGIGARRRLSSLLAWLWLVAPAAVPAAEQWWKGNLHTHTLWSDGDDFPESVADWYRTNGYHFLALSDHNILQTIEKWVAVTNATRRLAFEKAQARFGANWLECRAIPAGFKVRLHTLAEFRGLVEERGRFVLIPSEELSDHHRTLPLHVNATNLREFIQPRGGTNVTDVLQRNIDAVLAQRKRTGQPMFPHVNHPNFGWAITAEDMMPLRGERFFEVYNGHPSVHNEGDEHHAGVERVWDLLLAFRLAQFNTGPLFGLAVDDSHHYHRHDRTNSNSGRGWVMVRAARLDAASLLSAMEAGDFYASSGVRLKTVHRSATELSLEIDAEPGVTYTTQFIGTLRGFDPSSHPGRRPKDSLFPVTRDYEGDIGATLAVTHGLKASYRPRGDELYVRAKVISSKPKLNAVREGEPEAAWVQPIIPPAP